MIRAVTHCLRSICRHTNGLVPLIVIMTVLLLAACATSGELVSTPVADVIATQKPESAGSSAVAPAAGLESTVKPTGTREPALGHEVHERLCVVGRLSPLGERPVVTGAFSKVAKSVTRKPSQRIPRHSAGKEQTREVCHMITPFQMRQLMRHDSRPVRGPNSLQ